MSTRRSSDAYGIDDVRVELFDEWARQPFESGFTGKVVLGAVFIAVVMLPGLIYMGLVVGTNIGSGAEWVTVLLFLELARRSYQKLKRQELMVIHHMALTLTGMINGVMLCGGIFAAMIWQQYLKQSDVFRNFNLTDQMPEWFSPGSETLAYRSFFDTSWLPAVGVAVLAMVLYKIQFFGIGYFMFRITSDVEQLPFPMARVGAEGATALAESESQERESWRWNVFSTLGVAGVVWGLVYMGIPTLSGALFGVTTSLIPIPFLDLSPALESWLPSAEIAIGFNLGLLLLAFVLPWRVVLASSLVCILIRIVLPPVFYEAGIHTVWQPGFGALDTRLANSLDIWISVTIGAALSIFVTGVFMAVRGAVKARRSADGRPQIDWRRLWRPPADRGDLPLWLVVLLFVVAASGFVMLVHGIVNLGWLGGFAKPRDQWFPIWMLAVFAFVWTPVSTYVTARLMGICGQRVPVPFVREGSFFLSGYRHSDIWFSPIPLHDFGQASTLFKQLETTRVKFSSLIKVELLTLILLTFAGYFYWSYIWRLGPVPSDAYPFAQKMWPFIAKNMALWASALGEGNNQMIQAIKPEVILGTAAGFTGLFFACMATGLPLAYYFGAVSGIGTFTYMAIPMLVGLGLRFLVSRRLGSEKLTRYAPVMMAGFSAGFGISGMLIVSVVLIKSAISALLY
jgi:hypothetical protein